MDKKRSNMAKIDRNVNMAKIGQNVNMLNVYAEIINQ